jgi:multiple sugar transport system substrate-binding protein
MMWWGGDARTQAYQQALAVFDKRRTDLTITTEHSVYDGYFTRFDVEVAGGSAPDVVQMDTALVHEYARRGVLQPLDDYLGNGLDLGAFPDALLGTGRANGVLFGVPSGTGAVLLTYDNTVLAAHKLAAPTPEWHWTDLKTIAARMTRSIGGGVYGVSDAGGDDYGALQIFLRQRRKDLFTESGALGYDRDDLREWLTFWDEMRRTKAAAPGDVTSAAGNDAKKNPLITGRVAMTFGVGLEISLPTLTTHDLDFIPVPRGPAGSVEGQYLSGGVLLSVIAQTQYPKDAVDVIDFFATDEDAVRIMGLTRGIPPTEKARQVAATHLSPVQQRALVATDLVAKRVAAARTAPPPAPPKGAAEVKELLFDSNMAVAFGRKTIAAAVESFFAGAASALS